MVQKATSLIPADRCGVFWVKVFHVYGGEKKIGHIGDFVKSSIKELKTKKKQRKKMKVVSILIRLQKLFNKRSGFNLFFKTNCTILLKKRMTPRGKEVSGPILWNIRRRKFRVSFPSIL